MAFRFRSFGGSSSNQDDNDDEHATASDCGYDSDTDALGYSSDETGLEMEAMLGSGADSVRRHASRTNSGTLLYTRRGSGRGGRAGTASNDAYDAFCPDGRRRSETALRTAYARFTRRTSRRGGNVLQKLRTCCLCCTTHSTTSARRPLSTIALICLIVILFSLSFNLFEGNYLQAILGNVQEKSSKSPTQPMMTPITSTTDSATTTTTTTATTSKKRPTKVSLPTKSRPRPATITTTTTTVHQPAPPTPTLSIPQHMELLRQSNMTHMANSFTTWLDLDVDTLLPTDTDDLTPRKKHTNGSAFATELCETRGTSWYPSNSSKKDNSWQLRAPAFLLPGAAYSGTVYLAAALHQHPLILPARTKELQFFHERPFRRYVTPSGTKTLVLAARERMYAQDFDVTSLKRNPSTVSFDATPGYLFYSTLTPLRILCVEPWVKLVVLLRNPVDRVLEHYAAATKRGLQVSLEHWIDQEFNLMQRVGLISAPENTHNQHPDQSTEDAAWYNYTSATVEGGVGRSMYVIQIRHWINAFLLAGRDPSDAIVIVRTDRLGADPVREYTRVLDFLGLEHHALRAKDSHGLPLVITHQTRSVSDETRQRLEDFFRPYNVRLKRLLLLYGISSEHGRF